MSLLDVHEQELEAVSNDLVARPRPAPAPVVTFNGWRTTTAAPRGVAAGAAESSGFAADVLGAFGQSMAATGDTRAGGMFGAATPAEQRQTDEARQKLITSGPDYTSEAGDLFRGVSRGYRPDPQTAHVAESLVFDASRVITKAVGYSLAGGPLTGAALTGLDEGMQVSDDLRLQGVDLETRTKAGAVQGAGVALGVALPVAGKTLAGTAALVGIGGPGAFIAQQAATRQILQSAGYDSIAQSFDPFDPVGLAVSTIVPAGFGAYALRRARAKPAAAGAPQAEPAARAEAPEQVMRADPEAVDAARVSLAVEQAEASRLTSPVDLPARAAEDAAIVRAEEQLASGEPVRVDAPPPAPEVLPRFDPAVLDDPTPIAAESRAATMPLAEAIDEAAALVGPARLQELATPRTAAPDGQPVAPDRVMVEAIARRVVDHFERNPDAMGAMGDFAVRVQRGAREAVVEGSRRARAEAATGLGQQVDAAPMKPAKEPAAGGKPEKEGPPAPSARAAQIAERYPDLQVQLEGMDGPVSVRELVAGVKAEADHDVANAPLLAMAAECAITG
jgi:hypothetical protein